MRMFAGLDVGFERTAMCVLDEAGRIVWRGVVDTHLLEWRRSKARLRGSTSSSRNWRGARQCTGA